MRNMSAQELSRLRDALAVSRADQLRDVLDRHHGERHIIVIQSFPDPDAISSALAHQMIAGKFGIATEIAYDGLISHHENIALVEILDIPLVRVTEGEDFARFQGSVFIDTQGTTTGLTERLAARKVPVIAIVDHHEPQRLMSAEFTDIRSDANATATIYVEYLQQGLLPLDRSDPDHGRLATALIHGIRSETLGMIRAERPDLVAASYVSDFVDRSALEAILSIQRTRNAMDIIQTALSQRIVRDNYCLAGVGDLRYEDRDAIPQAADFLLTEENVHTAIVYGLVSKAGEREMIAGSLRTKKPTLNPDSFLKEALGGPKPGAYYGGGRREAGGFEIPVGFLAGADDDEFLKLKWQIFDLQIKRKLWHALGIEDAGADVPPG
jgi:nanoRNase/pAp phosphatase (c-di-AMP/oligoRNAs hydrolase)